MTLFMKVTKDKYELPIAVAESVHELSLMTGDKKMSIWNAIGHRNRTGYKTAYVRVEVDDDE